MKKIAFLLIVLLCGNSLIAQEQLYNPKALNNYKYVIIPMQYPFQTKPNEYLLNSRVKHLLDLEGFITLVDTEKYPEDLTFNPCLALHAVLKSGAESFFATHTELTLILKNCRNEVVFETQTGKSKMKDIGDAYKDALHKAFRSFVTISYKYNGNQGVTPEVKEKKETPKEEKTFETPLSVTLGKTYTYDEKQYAINKIGAGYLLIEKKTNARVALLHFTDSGTILYNSKAINGTATVLQNGAVIKVEYFDQQEGKLKKMLYRTVQE